MPLFKLGRRDNGRVTNGHADQDVLKHHLPSQSEPRMEADGALEPPGTNRRENRADTAHGSGPEEMESPTKGGRLGDWTSLDERIKEARAQLESVLAVREEAQSLRTRAREISDRTEAVREEARLIGRTARRALERLAAVNPSHFAPTVAALRKLDEARKTQRALLTASQTDAWVEADRARIRASSGLLKTLSALSTAITWVGRELEEGNNLLAGAESLAESAQQEFKSAQASMKEFLLDGSEVQELLGMRGFSEQGLREKAMMDGGVPHQPLKSSDMPQISSAAPGQEVMDTRLQGEEASIDRIASSPLEDGDISASAIGNVGGAQELDEWSSELLKDLSSKPFEKPIGSTDFVGGPPGPSADGFVGNQRKPSETGDTFPPGSNDTSNGAAKAWDMIGMRPGQHWPRPNGSAGETEQISEEALKRELFDLRQSLAPFRASHDSVGGTPEAHGPSPEGLDTEVGEQPTTPAPERTPERRASPDNGQSELDTPFAKGPEYPVAESGLAGIGTSSTLGEHAGPDGLPEAASASGTVAAPSVTDSRRLSLVFIPCPDSEQLGTLWEALDRIAGTGGIVDARPLGGDGGFEFILGDLDDETQIVEELRAQMPQAQILKLSENKLEVRGGHVPSSGVRVRHPVDVV